MNHVLANTWCDVGWQSEGVAVVAVFASNFYMPAKRKNPLTMPDWGLYFTR